jgi:hypothetical protein
MTRRNKPKYRADLAPESSFWDRLSEEEKILAIIQHHRLRSIKLPNPRVHALAHLMVEQQLSSGESPAAVSTLERLLDEGLDRHEAIHAIGWALTTTMNEAAAGELDGDLNATYEHRLSLLPESWWSEFEDDLEGS